MKKNSIIIALVVLSATLFSCQKENLNQSTGSILPASTGSANRNPAKIVSSWLSLGFTNSAYQGIPSLQAVYTISPANNYSYSDYVHLAFARKMGRDSYSYFTLPAVFSNTRGNTEADFSLDHNGFTINAWNVGPIPLSDIVERPDKSQFEKMQYQFIVIPRSTYRGLNIDWNDYSAVATALNL